MQRFFAKTIRLLSTPGMLTAYANWQFNKKIFRRLPSVNCSPRISISNWINFSEYWSFYRGIPEFEKIFIFKSLQDSQSKQNIAFDVGANIGIFTVTLADLENVKVHSFEPISYTFDRLKANVARNDSISKNVVLNRAAVGLTKEKIEFQVFVSSPAINRLYVNKKSNCIDSNQTVSVISLDDYCSKKQIKKIDFVKIDVEGMETQVFQGAINLLQKKLISVILLEICPRNLSNAGNSVDSLYEIITQYGYVPYRISKNGSIGSTLKLNDLKKIVLENIAVVPSFFE